MIIKRSSWHYKFNNLVKPEMGNENLCSYFWRFIGKCVVVLTILAVFLIFAYSFIISPFVLLHTAVLLFITSIVIIPAVSIHYLRRIFKGPITSPKENFIMEYIKAKKNKVCPLITYID